MYGGINWLIQLVRRALFKLLTALIKYLTVLLECIEISILAKVHIKHLGGIVHKIWMEIHFCAWPALGYPTDSGCISLCKVTNRYDLH